MFSDKKVNLMTLVFEHFHILYPVTCAYNRSMVVAEDHIDRWDVLLASVQDYQEFLCARWWCCIFTERQGTVNAWSSEDETTVENGKLKAKMSTRT